MWSNSKMRSGTLRIALAVVMTWLQRDRAYYNARVSDANYIFMCRQLIAGAVPPGESEDVTGGAWVAGEQDAWLGLWSPELWGDPEPHIRDLQRKAEDTGRRWAGVVLLQPEGQAVAPGIGYLEEALFVYGYLHAPRAPGIVLLQGKPKQARPPAGYSFDQSSLAAIADDSELDELLREAQHTMDPMLTAPTVLSLDPTARLLVADKDGAPVGLLALGGTAMLGRIELLYTKHNERGHGVASQLLQEAAKVSAEAGQLTHCAWCQREGNLRYFLAKRGYTEQFRVWTFVAE
jgi:hypothetical protein